MALGNSAYAEPQYVEDIIRKEKAKVGDRIDALDGMITPDARRETPLPAENSYIPGRYAAAAERNGIAVPHRAEQTATAPVSEKVSDRFQITPPLKEEEIVVKGEEEIRGDDVVAEVEPKERVRLPPLFDPGPARAIRPIAKPERAPIQEAARGTQTRLTDPLPSKREVSEPANGFWDELNAARERARRALTESWQVDDSQKAQPVNYPSGFNQTANLRNEISAAERLAPQQASLGGFSGSASPITDDVIAQEVKEVEEGLGGGILDPAKEAPLLRPKFVAQSKRSRRQMRRLASAMSQSKYARGARKEDSRREEDSEFEPSAYKYVPENYYRHLTPQNGVGHSSGKSGIRTHNAYGDSTAGESDSGE